MPTTNEPEYIDRAAAMTADAREANKEILKDEFMGFRSDVELVKTKTIAAVNRAIKMGDTIQEFTGHKKLLPAEYGQFALAINDAPLDFAKECVSLCEKNQTPITTYEQAAPIFEHLLVQYELLPKPGHGEQTKHPHEPVLDYISAVINVDAESVELLEENPMDKWEPFQRASFYNNSKRILDLHEEVGKTMKAKGEL